MNYGINAINIPNKNIMLVILAGVICLNVIPFPVFSPVLILLIGIILGLLIISIFAQKDFNFLFGFYLLGFGLRAFLSFLFYLSSFCLKGICIPGFIFKNDGLGYSQQGWFIYKFMERGIYLTMDTFLTNPNLRLFAGTEGGLSGNITDYDFFTAFIYSITGRSLLSLFFISTLAGSLAALMIYFIARELFSKRIARIASLFAFFWPSFILWSTQHLKEPMIALFIFILLWTIIYSYKYFFPGVLLLSFASVWVLWKIGFVYLVVVICMVSFTGFFLFMNHLFKNKLVAMLAVCLLLFSILFLFKDRILSMVFEKSVYSMGSYNSIFEFLDYMRRERAYGNLAFFKDFDLSSFGNTIIFIPVGFLYAIFAPFPWQLGSVNQIIAIPETILFYILFPFTLKGVILACRKRFNQSILLLSIIVAMLSFLGIVEGNAGTLFRHRSICFYLLFIFTAIGISLTKRRKNILKNEA